MTKGQKRGDTMSYANTKEAKQEKRQILLEEVWRRMASQKFDQIKMVDIAKGSGVSKGTVFNYFESKETLFLILLMREYGRWFDGLVQKLTDKGQLDRSGFVKVVSQYIGMSIEKDERLFKLIGLGHSHLEHNVSLRIAEQYRRFLNDKTRALGLTVSEKVDGINFVQGIKLMMNLHAFFVGHGQMARLPEIMEKELALDELEAYEIDFRVTLMDTLKVYMNGAFL